MKNILTIILVLTVVLGYSQAATKVNNAQNVWTVNHDPAVLLECDPILSGLFRPRIKDSIYWETYNINGLENYIKAVGDIRYKAITYTPTYGEIIASLGFTPYSDTNPAGYISSFTEVDPTVPPYSKSLTAFSAIKVDTDLLYEPIFSKNTAFNKNFGTTTGTVAEGNDTRIVNAVQNTRTLTINGVTFDLSANRTWTVGDVTTATLTSSLATKEPIITAGTNLQYWRGDKTWQTLNTTVVPEGTNLYYTDARARASISLTTTGSGAASYSSSTGVLNIPTSTSYTAGTGISIASNIITNTAPDQIVSLTAGNRIQITGTYPNFTIAYIEPTTSVVTRTLNSNFTVSSTLSAFVSYTITCQVVNPLLAGSSTANAYLEYSTNGGSTWLMPAQNGNASAVGVAVAVAITNTQTVTLCSFVPANALVRIRTATTGTASVTYVTGNERF